MPEIFLPTLSLNDLPKEINLQIKDGDPRKTSYFRWLLSRHKRAVQIWQNFGLMAKGITLSQNVAKAAAENGHTVREVSRPTTTIPNDAAKNFVKPIREVAHGWERRMHMAPEHMATVIAGVQALGQLLQEKGLLSEQQVMEVEQAAAVHDAGKELEFKFVNAALSGEATEYYRNILNEMEVTLNNPSTLDKLLNKSLPLLDPQFSQGRRAQAAYDLASTINELRLQDRGIEPNVLAIQKMVGHTSCPDMEYGIEVFDSMSEDKKHQFIQMLVMHYADDIVTNPNVIVPKITYDDSGNGLNALDDRCKQNETNKKYKEYNEAWKTDSRNESGETAFEMQRRVGHSVEEFLARLLGIDDPLRIPQIIDQRIKDNILKHWAKTTD